MWPFKLKRRRTAGALALTPGPSPWYLCRPGTELDSLRGRLSWKEAGNDSPRAGKSVLTAIDGTALAVLDFYCYVRPMSGHRFVLWHPSFMPNSPPGNAAWGQSLRFVVVDTDELRPLADLEAACQTLSRATARVWTDGGLVAETQVPSGLFPGEHYHPFPQEMQELEELLVLAAPAADQLALWVVNVRLGQIEVFPQDWFNQGNFDYGYQWVTRVAREPGTGRIVGEGIRISPFALDHTYRHVAGHINGDLFYGPEA
jgi:hypothetical protein